jgi:PAS domain S-box-containing protein
MVDTEDATERFAVLDRAPIGQFVLNGNFEVVFWNRCLENWTGIRREEIVGTSILNHYPHLGVDKYSERIKTIFEGGPPTVFSSQLHKYTIPAHLPGGKFRVQYTVVTNIPTSDRKKYDAIFSIQDVTSLTEALESNKAALKKVSKEVEERKRVEKELEELVRELQDALAEIKTLRGIIPICASCKKIRDDKGYWTQMEAYIRDHSQAEFSHGICPKCTRELYPELSLDEK